MAMKIIPGLPDDLGLQCLIKVPYKFHKNVRAVSKSWNTVLSSSDFYQERQRLGEYEEGIASVKAFDRKSTEFGVTIFYPLGNWWEKLPLIPKELGLSASFYYKCVYVRSKQNLVVLGFRQVVDMKEIVLIFNFLSRRWSLGLEMPLSLHHRRSSACAASTSPEGLVYIAGGYNIHSRKNRGPHQVEAFAYNIQRKRWFFLPRMNHDLSVPYLRSFGAFVDGKFYVIPCRGVHVQAYDPLTRTWENIKSDRNPEGVIACVAAFGFFYWFSQIGDSVNMQQFHIADNSLILVDEFPLQQFRHIFCAVPLRDCILVSGSNSTDLSIEVYLFHVREEEKRWTRIERPAGADVCSTSSVVQI